MKNAIFTGIVAGVMGFATVADAGETANVGQTVEYELSLVVAEAHQVAAQIVAGQDQLSEFEAALASIATQLRVLNSTREGAASDAAARMQAAVDQMNGEIRNLEASIAAMQQTLARLVNTIERMVLSGVPVQALGEPAI